MVSLLYSIKKYYLFYLRRLNNIDEKSFFTYNYLYQISGDKPMARGPSAASTIILMPRPQYCQNCLLSILLDNEIFLIHVHLNLSKRQYLSIVVTPSLGQKM